MVWTIDYAASARTRLRKLDKQTAKRIVDFMDQRIAKSHDPRSLGQALTGPRLGEYWRYRVGDMRIICDIRDGELVVLVIEVANRRNADQ